MVLPVPPLAVKIAVPLQVPEVMVPTVARADAEVSPDKVVIKGKVVVDISIFPLLRAVKLSFIVVREFLRVSVD